MCLAVQQKAGWHCSIAWLAEPEIYGCFLHLGVSVFLNRCYFCFAVPMAGSVCPQVGNHCHVAPQLEAAEASRAHEPSECFFPRDPSLLVISGNLRFCATKKKLQRGWTTTPHLLYLPSHLRIKGSPAQPRHLCLKVRRPR